MRTRGVLVTCTPSGGKDFGVCSGILFLNNWILTLGTILDSIFQHGKKNNPQFEEHTLNYLRMGKIIILPKFFKKNSSKFSILMDDVNSTHEPLSDRQNSMLPVNVDTRNEKNQSEAMTEVWSSESSQNVDRPSSSPRRLRRPAQLTAAWRCPLVAEDTSVVLGGWQLSATDVKQDDQATFKLLLSTFVLLRIEDDQTPTDVNNTDVIEALGQLMDQLKLPTRGDEVIIESTIFGREFFFNSWSQGIVSNVFGKKGSLFVTDARSGLGCEGGPIFTCSKSNSDWRLAGMVLSPVCWWKGEWVGFTIGVALYPMLASLREIVPGFKVSTRILGEGPTEQPALDKSVVDASVLLVRCGATWGSGVVVDSTLGLVLTCSHVVRKWQSDVGVGISVWWRGASLPAVLVYRTRRDVAYDLALLRVTPPSELRQVVMSPVAAVKGEEVFAVGFPMFSEREIRSIVPIVTRGIVAHVATSMVQTTCCVQSGASGGPVLRASGEMVGIVSCNANDLDTGALFPHVNMAIPTTVFAEHVQRYIDTLDVGALKPLEARERAVQEMWKLQFTPSKL